jgi:hypothetical protein
MRVYSGKVYAVSKSEDELELLEDEGVTVVNDRIKNWKAVCWNPMKEINL